MEPIKIIIFVAAALALFVLGRILSASSEVHAASVPKPALPGTDDGAYAGALAPTRGELPLTGSEFGFPFKLPPVTQLADGTYNRPNFVDYYFSKTDLVRGPADPESFLDELCLKAEDPVNGYKWDCNYTVATPAGLRKVMEQEKFASLYLDGGVVIVPRWDLANILHTVVDEIMKDYGNKQREEEGSAEPGTQTS